MYSERNSLKRGIDDEIVIKDEMEVNAPLHKSPIKFISVPTDVDNV